MLHAHPAIVPLPARALGFRPRIEPRQPDIPKHAIVEFTQDLTLASARVPELDPLYGEPGDPRKLCKHDGLSYP